MKKIILLVLLLSGLFPVIQNHKLQFQVFYASATELEGVEVCSEQYPRESFKMTLENGDQVYEVCHIESLDCETGEIFDQTCEDEIRPCEFNCSGGNGNNNPNPGGGDGPGGDDGYDPPNNPDPDPTPKTDCADVVGGTATRDACGTCVGGNTGLTAHTWYKDADGDGWGGTITKSCYNAGSGWVGTSGDLNDDCYNTTNDADQCKDDLIDEFCNDAATTQAMKNNISATLAIIKSENCGYKSMYEELINPTSAGNNSDSLKISLDFCVESLAYDRGYNAAFDPATNKIKFNGDAGTTHSVILSEELFHAYQDNFYAGGTNGYGRNPTTGVAAEGFANIEFEHKVFRDIAQGEVSAYGSMNAPSLKLEYQDWLKSITNDFTTYPSLTPGTPEYNTFITGYNQQLANWNGVSGNPYHSDIDSNLDPDAMLYVLKKNPKNCTP